MMQGEFQKVLWERVLILPIWGLLATSIHAQCPFTIATFPYNEGFEGQAAWTSGGFGNDWAWGAPNKAVIDAAGGGTNCWVTGGLTGSSYSDGQQSWLASPCFNFSGLTNPYVSFKVFWECERDYDGLAFQYSLDQGNTWTNVGAFGAQVNCLNQNWYNTQYISNLDLGSPQQGWSGRIGNTVGLCTGGQGSNGWVTASHCLQNLAGQSSVKFRFIFGAGTTCNNYDGVAVDDIFIGSAPPNQAAFTFTCDGNAVNFESTSALCPTSFLWDFGDPASGAANTSTLENPVHNYPGPGTYNVTLTVSGPCNASSTVTQPVSVLGLEFVTEDPSCAGSDGSIIALVSGTSVPLDVVWTPGGQTTVVLTGVGPGVYGVTVTAPNACPVQGTVELLEGGVSLSAEASFTDVTCNGLADGTATVTVQGGSPDYTYAWAPAGGNGASASDLAAGEYTCTVTDAVGCSVTTQVLIVEPAPLLLEPQPDLAICNGATTTLQPVVSGGTPAYSVTYLPEGPEVAPTSTTTYNYIATDANGCLSNPGQTIVTVGGPDAPALSVDDPEGCAPHCVSLEATSSFDVTYSWDLGDGSTAEGATADHCFQSAGEYAVTLTITDADGCSRTAQLPDLIGVQASPVAGIIASPSVTTIESPTVLFSALPTGAEVWLWDLDDADLSTAEGEQVSFTFTEVDCYTVSLVVAGELGCTDSTAIEFCVEDRYALYAPNAFTPDGDGINEVFNVATTVAVPRAYELRVFDRWGQVVYETLALDKGWDGTASGAPLPVGVYAWRLRLQDTEGTVQEAQGHVTLIR